MPRTEERLNCIAEIPKGSRKVRVRSRAATDPLRASCVDVEGWLSREHALDAIEDAARRYRESAA
jgi:inorganic pyrophosphatase